MKIYSLLITVIGLVHCLPLIVPPFISGENVPIEERNVYRDPCDDGVFMIPVKLQEFDNSCPAGFELADLSNDLTLQRGVATLFFCLGPSSRAWIGKAKLNGKVVNGPLELMAPSAIEKEVIPTQKNGISITPFKIIRKTNKSVSIPPLCQQAGNPGAV